MFYSLFFIQVLLTGILGVLASKSDVNYGSVPPPKARCLVMIGVLYCFVFI